MSDELNDAERREVGRKARVAILEVIKALGGEGTRAEILSRAAREGGFTARELGAAAPETARDKYELFVEYRLSWALSNLKREGLLENPRWSVWQLAGTAAKQPRPLVSDRPSLERLVELRAMSERQYLQTSEWRKTRAAALVRADHVCSLDRTHSQDLEVHHNTYERVGAELPEDLVVLCRSCHRLYHKHNGRPRRPKTEEQMRRLREAASIGPPAPGTDGASGGPRDDIASSKSSLLRRIIRRD